MRTRGISSFLFIGAFVLALGMVSPGPAQAARHHAASKPAPQVSAQQAADQAYLAAVDRMISGQDDRAQVANWTKLRDMYTRTSFYFRKGGADKVWDLLQESAQKALLDGSDASVAAYRALLRDHFAHYRSHVQAIEMIDKAHFTQEDKTLHLTALRGILSSILASGDGKTGETAFHIIDPAEENLVMTSYFHYQVKDQKYEQHNGHFWDIVSYVNPANGTTGKMYFNVDALVGSH
ncbi:MAG: DUF4919 domain-containing protein [Alphaproteobacteria bacterium]|nr:DUF4919 domain-containing protein [Alphaproteobacteria bacterium]